MKTLTPEEMEADAATISSLAERMSAVGDASEETRAQLQALVDTMRREDLATNRVIGGRVLRRRRRAVERAERTQSRRENRATFRAVRQADYVDGLRFAVDRLTSTEPRTPRQQRWLHGLLERLMYEAPAA